MFEVPFNSVVKYSLAIVTDPGSRNNQLCFMKVGDDAGCRAVWLFTAAISYARDSSARLWLKYLRGRLAYHRFACSLPSSTPARCFPQGAPEIVLSRCTEYMYGGATRPIDDAFTADWLDAYERFGSMGERVLGLACASQPSRTRALSLRTQGPKDVWGPLP